MQEEHQSPKTIDDDLFEWLPLFEGLASAFIELDEQSVIMRSRGDATNLLGLCKRALIGIRFRDLIHDKDLPIWRLVEKSLLKKSFVGPLPLRIKQAEGKAGAVEISAARKAVRTGWHIQIALTKYAGHLSIDPAQRPASSQARQFKEQDFQKLAARLSRYRVDEKETAVAALLRLAGSVQVGGGEISEGAAGLWALYRLLNDAAGEQAADAKVEENRKAHQTDNTLAKESTGDDAAKKDGDGNMQAAVRSAYKSDTETNYVNIGGQDGISESEAVKAAVYAMKKAATSGNAQTMKALTGSYERRLESVRAQLRLFKQIVVQEKFDASLQPIVNMKDGSLHHFEALARFDASVYSGPPFEFINFAEDIGVIHEFDLAMTMKVVSMLKRIRRLGYNASIAVNISGRSIQSPAFLRHFFRILEDCSDLRQKLSFELTESSQIEDLETTNRVLSRIRDFGHKVALDDFGAGAAGLQYLRALKVDYVKIDGVYIRRALEESDSRAFLRSISELCSSLNIATIGECIETKDQQSLLSGIGVAYGQGWLFGKPLPVDQALENFCS